jgi:RNA polymerase sigma-70 factor (ECF subfamily)
MADKKRRLRSVGANEPVNLSDVVHPSQLDFEDEFETLLDEQGDAEFGELILKDTPNTAATERATLKTWTSQDFSNIYMRFRPHLERYAKRWLNNQSQIDEVVQDAFLYLMVTLPELDSEIGVLRFLKWKTRLLCLDVIRASGRAVINNIDDHELAADVPESSAALEAADDAAVVRLALSKLTPRHREVLIATMYEEKSIAEVAAQVALSENATRQLMFRARAAFKQALVGEVDTAGMSMVAILSVAARKAATEVQKQGAKALISLFVLVLAIGSFLTFGNRGQTEQAPVAEAPATQGSNGAQNGQNSANTANPGNTNTGTTTPTKATAAAFVQTVAAPKHAVSYDPSVAISGEHRGYVNQVALRVAANLGQPQEVQVFPSGFVSAANNGSSRFHVQAANGKQLLNADFLYSSTNGVSNLTFQFLADGLLYTAYAQDLAVTTDAQGNLVVTGLLSDLIDGQNVVLSGTDLRGATVTLALQQSSLTADVQSAVLTIAPRS